MRKFRSPYDVPREAENHARDLVVSAVRMLVDAASLSLLPAAALVMFTLGLSWANQQEWLLHPEQFAVNVLAAFSVGCVRSYLRQDNQQQEVELRC